MKGKITIEGEGATGIRTIENSDQICQLVCDLVGYFLPRYKHIKATVKVNDKEHVLGIENKAAVCELMDMMWNEWRFEDNEYETI